MTKFNLRQQIEEIDRELKMRASVYPRWVHAGKIKQSQADYHIARLEAVKTTLTWLQENETKIREAIKPTADAHSP